MLEQIESRKSMSWNASVELLVSVPIVVYLEKDMGGMGLPPLLHLGMVL